jgi:hypothetical protein
MYSDVFSTSNSRLKKFYEFYTEEKVNCFNKRYRDKTLGLHESCIYKTYYEIIHKIVLLCNEMSIKNPNEVSLLFEYLLWNGYFSRDKVMYYSFNRVIVPGLYGASIMDSKGVCLNTACMLTDILCSLNIEAYTVGCSIPMGKAKCYYIPPIKRFKDLSHNVKKGNYNYEDKLLLPVKERAEHAVTLYKTVDGYVYSDTVNMLFLNNDNILKASYVGANKSVIIKPYCLLLQNEVSYESFRELFEDVLAHENFSYMDVDFMINFSERIIEVCKNSVGLFNDFYDDIRIDIDEVCRELKRYN